MMREMRSSYQCHACGKQHQVNEENYQDFTDNLFHRFTLSFGYGSPFDGESFSVSLCELCILKMLVDFQVLPNLAPEMLATLAGVKTDVDYKQALLDNFYGNLRK